MRSLGSGLPYFIIVAVAAFSAVLSLMPKISEERRFNSIVIAEFTTIYRVNADVYVNEKNTIIIGNSTIINFILPPIAPIF